MSTNDTKSTIHKLAGLIALTSQQKSEHMEVNCSRMQLEKFNLPKNINNLKSLTLQAANSEKETSEGLVR